MSWPRSSTRVRKPRRMLLEYSHIKVVCCTDNGQVSWPRVWSTEVIETKTNRSDKNKIFLLCHYSWCAGPPSWILNLEWLCFPVATLTWEAVPVKRSYPKLGLPTSEDKWTAPSIQPTLKNIIPSCHSNPVWLSFPSRKHHGSVVCERSTMFCKPQI